MHLEIGSSLFDIQTVLRSFQFQYYGQIYGTRVCKDDEEMMIWVLQMILAMESKEKAKIAP